ncbi:unnamed protein product [Lymnaea stagnalis]|uniref:Fas-binding factor 1 C-terminal domain-containing protein n=1 Tax=Lymnaea stagnalis TaxID=6523 RepID=A0AAV2HDU3_LYMST
MTAESDAVSDISEADVDKVAHSLGGLDDLDADLFGDALSKKTAPGRPGAKPTTPRRMPPKSKGSSSPTRVQSPTGTDPPLSPPGSGRASLKRKPVKPPSPAATQPNPTSLPQTQPEHKPGTAPGKMSDLSLASESLVPGQKTVQRPETAPKIKKKYDFGDFDPDDPLAGVLSDDANDFSESDRPKSATRKPVNSTQTVAKAADSLVKPVEKAPLLESPRRRNLMDRPPTRSGNGAGDNGGTDVGGDDKHDYANSGAGKNASKTQPGIFSDSDNDLLDGLGLEGKGTAFIQKHKAGGGEELRPARSVFDSLLGKGPGAASTLLEPKEKKPFVLDSKYNGSLAGGNETKEEEDDFFFGNYQPSAASGSRPNSRRSVRFQDDDDIFGIDSRPSPRTKSPGSRAKPPPDMEWLELAANTPPATTATSMPSSPPVTATTTTSASTMNSVVTKPPTPAAASKLDSPRKSAAKEGAGAPPKIPVANTTQSPKAWLGLQDSESDDELFKPKKSSVRSASLPQSPALSAQASPRIFPKKPNKRDSSSPKPSPAVSVSKDDTEDDDWLTRARQRRQQMLAKEEGKLAGEGGSSQMLSGQDKVDGDVVKVDMSSTVAAVVNMPASNKSEISNDVLSPVQGRAPTWNSPRTPLSITVSGGQLQASKSQVPHDPSISSDPRLKFSAATFMQEQSDTVPKRQQLYQHEAQQQQLQQQKQLEQQLQQLEQKQFQAAQLQQMQPLPSQLHQLQYTQLQEQKKAELLRQQQELQQMLRNTQNQFDSLARAQVVPSSLSIPSYAQITSNIDLPESLSEAHAKIRKLELEKSYSESLLESLKRRYEEEMSAIENSYKNRLQIVEDSNRKKEARLREENEELMQQHLNKVRQLEQEKSEASNVHYRKMEDFEREKAQDIEKLKEQHRLLMSTLKREQDEALERLARAKNQEINMVASANDTSKSLTAVVEQIQSNARDLGELQLKVDTWNRQGLDQREISLKSKDEQLRMLQERLTRQEEDNERERKRLEELIARMESQLREQSRTLDEERWKLKQDQTRVEAQQRALEDEKRLWLEQQTRERMTLDRSRESHLEEQRSSITLISEERRLLAGERAKFEIEQKTVREKLHQDTIRKSQAEAEYEVLMRTIAEEKSHQASRLRELQREEERIVSERSKLEREKAQLEVDQERLAKQARQIREQSEEIDRVTEAARRAQHEGEQAMDEAMQYNSQMERREGEVEKQLSGLKLMEEHITQEKLRLAREKKEVENLKKSSLCTNCRSPVNGFGSVPVVHQNGFYTPPIISTNGHPNGHLVLSSSTHHPSDNPLGQIAASIASDRAVRMLKIQAIKDKEFLEEENFYLESLRHTPYHSTTSKS